MNAVCLVFGLLFLFASFSKASSCKPEWESYDNILCIKYVVRPTVGHAEVSKRCLMLEAFELSNLTPRLLAYVVGFTGKYESASFWLGPNTSKEHSLFGEQPLQKSSSNDLDTKLHSYCYYIEAKEIHIGQCNEQRGFICMRDNVQFHKNIVPCPQGVEMNEYFCIWEHMQLLEHYKAEAACASRGGHLVNLNNKSKESYVKVIVHRWNVSFWIGAIKQDGIFKWSNGEIVENLKKTTHSNNEGNCVMLMANDVFSSDLLWLVKQCNVMAYAICEVEHNATLTFGRNHSPSTLLSASSLSTMASGLRCPYGDHLVAHDHNGVCFWKTTYEAFRLGWNDARQFCQLNGGNLASYKDASEEVLDLGDETKVENKLWIGLKRDRGSSVFKWSDGTPLTYSNWAKGQPNINSWNKLCVAHSGNESKWEVTYCGTRLWFICKTAKAVISPTPRLPTVKPDILCFNSQSSSLLSWLFHNGLCYAVSTQQGFSWKSANVFCHDNGGVLASIHSFEETDFILQMIPYHFDAPLWIGLRAFGLFSSFEWEDGSPLSLINWNEDEDHMSYVDTCATLDPQNGMWSKKHCDQLAYVLCKISKGSENVSSSTTPMPILPGFCPSGWYTFGNVCYGAFGRKFEERQRWLDAYKKCAEMGATMVSIHNQKEQDFLSMIVEEFEASTWIGLNSSIPRILFLWSDNTLMDFTNWDANEPNNHNLKEECVEIIYASKTGMSGKWNDVSCNKLRPFVCQLPKDPTLKKPGADPTICSEPKGWRKLGSSCYKIFSNVGNISTWLQAQIICKSFGGSLTSVKNYAVHSLLKNLLENLEGFFWIGMREKMANTYAWLGEYPVYYSNWLFMQPRRVSQINNCVAANSEDQWMIRNCNEEHSFICEIDKSEIPIIAVGNTDTVCPNTSVHWKDFGGEFCYIIEITSTKTWDEAMYACFKNGGYLTSFHSQNELEVISHHLKDAQIPVHIGLGKMQDGNFGWVDRSPLDFTNWAWDEPNNPDDHCVEMHTDVMTWNDISCSESNGYICSTPKIDSRNKDFTTTSKNEEKREERIRRSVETGGIVGILICVLVIMAIAAVSFYYCCPAPKIRISKYVEQKFSRFK